MSTNYGVIESAEFRMGGYQDCMIGLNVTFKVGDGGGVSAWIGEFAHTAKHRNETEWVMAHGKAMCRIAEVLEQAKVDQPSKLRGVPVKLHWEGHGGAGDRLKDWEIATELVP